MQMRRLEILEGLPDPVFEALLEIAYEKACIKAHGFCWIETYGINGKTKYAVHYERWSNKDLKVEEATETHPTKLLAWKQAAEELLK